MFGPSARQARGRAAAHGPSGGLQPARFVMRRVETRGWARHDGTRKRVPAGLKSGVSRPRHRSAPVPAYGQPLAIHP